MHGDPLGAGTPASNLKRARQTSTRSRKPHTNSAYQPRPDWLPPAPVTRKPWEPELGSSRAPPRLHGFSTDPDRHPRQPARGSLAPRGSRHLRNINLAGFRAYRRLPSRLFSCLANFMVGCWAVQLVLWMDGYGCQERYFGRAASALRAFAT